MLTKLAMTGFQKRWRDYLVLFSGLIMSSAIFYMFEALATNKTFLKQNTGISMVGIIFQFGSVLLTIITLGIYGLWLPIKVKKWQIAHTTSSPEVDEAGFAAPEVTYYYDD